LFDLKNHLKALVESHAPAGHEAPVREVIREAWKPFTDTLEQDKLGSLIGLKRGVQTGEPRRRIMLAAHMDEIGMMVRDVVDGFIYVHRLGGLDPRVMIAQSVIVHGRSPDGSPRQMPGLVASVPPHMLTQDKRSKYPTIEELIIDVGLPAEEVEQSVRIGDLVTVDAPLLELNGKRLVAKAFDDRACVAAVTACLQQLQGLRHEWDVYAAATVQEEFGLKGATTAAYKINPDIAIALDVTFAPQSGVPQDAASEIGGGPTLSMGPNFHIKLFDKIRDVARLHEIKLQTDVLAGHSGTDAWAIQVAQAGVPTGLLSISIKNMHSPIETLDLRDVERTGRLLALFIAGLEADFLAAIQWDDLKTESGATA
jgi:tetrahedral aminopeptidase